jgi:hypothetical protein
MAVFTISLHPVKHQTAALAESICLMSFECECGEGCKPRNMSSETENHRVTMMGGANKTVKSVTGIIRLEGTRFVQGLCYFIKYVKRKEASAQNINSIL